MRSVRIVARIAGTAPEEVFDRIVEFERYPDLVEAVQEVTVDRSGDPAAPISDWVVAFRNGLLRWREVDRLDRPGLRVEFEQLSGDFDVFAGVWVLTRLAVGTGVVFDARFDFGVPSLASIIDPVAVRVLTETIKLTMEGLFVGAVSYDDDAAPDLAVAAGGAP